MNILTDPETPTLVTMRGGASTTSVYQEDADMQGDDCGKTESTAAPGDRRPRIVTLQNMLKRVSHSPFHDQYKKLSPSNADASAPPVNNLQNKQNGVNGDASRMNPFYKYHMDSDSSNHAMFNKGRETSEDVKLNTDFDAPPEFQSTPWDNKPKSKSMENGHKLSEPQRDLFQTLTHSPVEDQVNTPSVGPNPSARGYFYDVTLNSPNPFKAHPNQPQSLSTALQSKNSDLLKGDVDDLFHAAKREEFPTERAKEMNLFSKSPSTFVDPFTSPSNMEDDVFQSPPAPVENPFSTEDPFQVVPNKSVELFHFRENKQHPFGEANDRFAVFSKENLDIFSSSSINAVDPFPSPIRRDLFQDVSSLDDPFGNKPSKQDDPFLDISNGISDIVQPLPSMTNSQDVFVATPQNTAPKATYSTLLFNSPSGMTLDTQPSPGVLKATPSRSPTAIQRDSVSGLKDILLTTPEGTSYDILQPTPFSRARNLAMSPKHSPTEMSHMPTIKRPPKPLPRSKPPRTEKPPPPERPPAPEKSLTQEKPPSPERPPTLAKPMEPEAAVPKRSPKAIIRRLSKPFTSFKPKSPETKSLDPENYVMFEDVLLLGQERCVEDWPEDSPQINPGFKPLGKFRLRRESLKMKEDSDGGSGEDQDGSRSQSKKKDKKFRMSLLSRRGSKDKFPDDTKEASRRTLSLPHKSSKEYFSEPGLSAGEDGEQEGVDYRQKKPQKTKVGTLLRSSSPSSMLEGKNINGQSKGTVLDNSSGEEAGEAAREEKKKKKMKIKFVPHRGFAITRDKLDDELRGAQGYTPRKGSKGDTLEDVEDMKGYSLQSANKAAFMDDEFHKTHRFSSGLSGDEDVYGIEDTKPKKQTKMKLPFNRRSSKEDMLDDNWKKTSFFAEELDEEVNTMEDCKQKTSKIRSPIPIPRKSKTIYNASGQCELIGFSHNKPQHAFNNDFAEDDVIGKEFLKPGERYDEQDEQETRKPKKTPKLKGLKKHKAKSKSLYLECEDPPGAASSDYLSEAAKAEWMAAQRDERARAGFEDEDEDGDTDSLMEWWYTVEQWDEVPSDEEDQIMKEDESKSFTMLANKVHRGLRLFNKVFTERAEVLWQSSITLNAVAEDLSDFHHKARIAGITGGTTTAVGGVTAIAGLALAPFTFGASLVVTAVGVGVAAAGGIASASAAISDNVNNMHDRKKVETVLQEYEAHLLTIGKILHFVDQGLYRLRGHPFLRSGTQHYSEDWEIRKAVQMIGLVDSPVRQAVEVTDTAVASVQGLFKGTDKYFIKDSGELKKSCKKELVALIKEVANVLNEAVKELNTIREELQDGIGDL